MVTAVLNDTDLRRRAWEAASQVVDPEIPVLTIADLGVLRDVQVHDGRVEVAITPTYSGCPAMNMIALEIELALERAGIARPTVRTVLSPAWTTDWMSEDGRNKLRAYGIAPPQASNSRRALFGEQQVACPQCGSQNTELLSEFGSTSCKALWRCKAAANRSIISSVIEVLHAVIASAAKQSIKPQRKGGLLRCARAARNDGEETLMSHAPRFHRLAVNDLRREAADAVSMTFAIPKELEDDYGFTPGQYLTLRTTMDGEEVRRSYSICSGPDDGELRIAVKKVDGGAFSNWAADELKPGDELDVMTPTGRFGIAHAPDEARIYVGFAAGSGITPILSIVKGVLAREPNSRFFLFYGNRSTSGMLFLEELEELKDRFMQRLSLFHVISGEEQDIPILHGRLDGEKVRVLLRSLVPAASVDHVFICGPMGMSEDIEATCREIGIAEDRIHVERFVSEFGGKPRPKKIIEASAPPKAMASLIIDGKRREVPVAEEESILDAALRAGMDLPFACKGGMCSTCRAKLVEGDAQMEVNYSLEPWELKAGFILTCQARPCSDKVVVDYDHV